MIQLGGRSCINTLIEFGNPMRPVKLTKMCLTETYSRFRECKCLSEIFLIKNDLKQGDDLSPLLFNLILDYAITSVQVNQNWLKLNGTYQLLFCADDNIGRGRTCYQKEHTRFSCCW